MKRVLSLLTFLLCAAFCVAADPDYTTSKEYLALRDSMHKAFNNADSARFFPAVKNLEDYLQAQNDVHGYYTQRCNEIVFLMNQQKIYEAYKLARELSQELREKKIDSEMYMAMNMLGHINNYCGNKEEAKKNWRDALSSMAEQGYYANMPPIYMNIVNVANDDDLRETDSLLSVALVTAKKYSPDRVFDIETRQTLSYYYRGDFGRFLEGYKAFKEGEKQGLNSVHGRSLEMYYLAYKGKTDEAIQMAKEELGDEGKDAIVTILEKAGRWQEAFNALKDETATSDSINSVILTNSMLGIRDELMLYEAYQQNNRTKFIGLTAVILLMALLILALTYIVQARRKHLTELKKAYQRATESEKMKASFIQWDIAPKKQKDLEDDIATGDAARMDRNHVVFTAVGDAACRIFNNEDFGYRPENTEQELGEVRQYKSCNRDDQRVKVSRKTLIKLLENMDCEYVKLGVTTDYPLVILGEIGEEYAGCAIAPVFEEENE